MSADRIAFSTPILALLFLPGLADGYATPKLFILGAFFVWEGVRQGWRIPKTVTLFLLCWPLLISFWAIPNLQLIQAFAPWCLYTLALVAPNSDTREAFLRGLGWSGVIAALYLAMQRLGFDSFAWMGPDTTGAFARGPFGNANFTGHFLMLALVLGEFKSGWTRMFGQAVILIGVIWSGSRGVWLFVPVWAWFQLEGRWRIGLIALVFLTTGFLVIHKGESLRRDLHYALNPSSFAADFEEEYRPPQEGDEASRHSPFRGKSVSMVTRVMLWANSMVMIGDYPLGAGPGQFHTVYPKYANTAVTDVNMSREYRAVSAHNLFLDSAIQLGLPWLVAGLWWLWLRLKKADQRLQLAVLIQLGLAMFSVSYLNVVIGAILLWLLEPTVEKKHAPYLAVLAGLLIFFVWLDHEAWQAEHQPDKARPLWLFPDAKAIYEYERNAHLALEYQIKAFEKDPYGPETIYNLGVLFFETGDEELGHKIWRLTNLMFPFYGPARTQVESNGQAPLEGDWRPLYQELVRALEIDREDQ